MVASIPESYADRLRAAMGAMSVQALADAMGISYQAVKKVLDEKSNAFAIPNHYKAAEVLSINPRWLGTGEGPKTGGGGMNGWPLSPELLAALHRARPEQRELIENQARMVLRLAVHPWPAEETDAPAA